MDALKQFSPFAFAVVCTVAYGIAAILQGDKP